MKAAEGPSDADGIIERLYEARRNSTTGLNLSVLSLSLDAALALQLKVLDRFVSAGDECAGWKISFTSGGGRDRMGAGFRPFGFIPRSRMLRSGESISLTETANLAIEPEMCLILERELAGNVTREEARSAVGSVAAAFELNETRCASEADNATILADGINNWGIVIGEQAQAGKASNEVTVELSLDGQAITQSRPASTMDDPFLSLARLSALLAKYGRRLSVGDHVITGSFCRMDVTGSGQFRATFDGIGSVALEVR